MTSQRSKCQAISCLVAIVADQANSENPCRRWGHLFISLPTSYTCGSAFLQRAREHNWLETHIWHAKRMFMECLWGYRLPARRCDKSLRASYRYVKRACTIHDSSYYWCIEVRGSPESVLSLIGSHVSPKPLRHVSELAKHEHSGIFADSNATSLGPVRVIFSSQDDGALQAWVWAHPSSAAKILDVLTANPAGLSVRKINLIRIELNLSLIHI